uniref:transposase n=1 Tax=Candidatus Enterovibrio escicola TaxID=1927127 RepID=UPI001CC2D6B0
MILRKRFIIETVFNQLKNISQIKHSRHGNCSRFMVNLLAGLIAYSFQPKMPKFDKQVLIKI